MPTDANDARFELVVKPIEDGYELHLREFGAGETGKQRQKAAVAASTCRGFPLHVLQAPILESLRQNGYKRDDLRRSRTHPFLLVEEDGIRLDLLFRALQGVTKRGRMEDMMLSIQHMSREEAYYWHAKTTQNNGTLKHNGIKALRVLTAGE